MSKFKSIKSRWSCSNIKSSFSFCSINNRYVNNKESCNKCVYVDKNYQLNGIDCDEKKLLSYVCQKSISIHYFYHLTSFLELI